VWRLFSQKFHIWEKYEDEGGYWLISHTLALISSFVADEDQLACFTQEAICKLEWSWEG
jgi:hypothetical protein